MKKFITDLKGKVDKYCTSTEQNDTSIFLYESCIYLEVRKILMERNIDCVQVYDGFYFAKGTMPNDMDEVIKEAFNRFLSNFHAYSYESQDEKDNIEDFLYKKITYDEFRKKYRRIKNNETME